MADDYLLAARRAILPVLKHSGPLLSLLPADAIYGGTAPAALPPRFIRFGTALAAPFRASGLDSSSLRLSLQAFTGDELEGGVVTVSAEDMIYRIGSAVKETLDDATIAIGGAMKLRLSWVQTSPRQDPVEASLWMTTVTFRGEVAG